MSWIITRSARGEKRYRAASGHLTVDRGAAKLYQSATVALDAAHEGDVIEQWAQPVTRPITIEE